MALSKKSIRLVLLIICLQMPLFLFSQSEAIQRTIENLSETQEAAIDFSELIDELENIQNNPINLNSDQITLLYQLFLIDENQLENLQNYIRDNGSLLSVFELSAIEGFSQEKIDRLLPFVEVKPIVQFQFPTLKQLSQHGRHDLLMRYQRIPENQVGYSSAEDSINLNSFYLGNADKYYLKYKYSYSNKFQMGVTAEKDAGELFLKEPTSVAIQNEIDAYFNKGFDFASVHLFGQNLGIVKQLVIGDYQLLLGQGLTLWTGLSYGKSADAVQLKKFESFIKPNTSANENGFLRGAAVHFGQKNWSALVFFSKNQQDASVQIDENGNEYVSGLLNTGFHRTVSELRQKNAMNIQLYGGRLKYTFNNFALGFTAYTATFSKVIKTEIAPDNLYDFRGSSQSNFGLDYGFNFWKAHFYGEFAYNSDGGKAMLSGVNIPFLSRMQLTLFYRNYQAEYHNLYATALSENGTVTNERGFFAGTAIDLTKKICLQAYTDFFSFPWLKYSQDAPSGGVEYRFQIFYELQRNTNFHFKFRYKQKNVNTTAVLSDANNFLIDQTKFNWQLQFNYALNDYFTFKNRIEIVQFNEEFSANSVGYMVYQDIAYRAPNQKFGSNTRLALFNTDTYASAIYAYENDVLYAFSIPAYAGQGWRFYQLIHYDISRNITFWIRYSLSYYPNQNTIGSGLDEISGQTKSEIKAQLRIKI